MKFQKSQNFSKTNKKGFTLIELLVVISIISLLSTVVMASLNEARRKARNAQVQQEVGQWIKAIELYKSDNDGRYPLDTFNSMGWNVCLGGVDSSCQNNLPGQRTPENQSFKNSLQKYINVNQNPNRKPVSYNVYGGRVSTYGVRWDGGSDVGYSGNYTVVISWYLEGTDWGCGYGGIKSSLSSGYYCYLELYQGFTPGLN